MEKSKLESELDKLTCQITPIKAIITMLIMATLCVVVVYTSPQNPQNDDTFANEKQNETNISTSGIYFTEIPLTFNLFDMNFYNMIFYPNFEKRCAIKLKHHFTSKDDIICGSSKLIPSETSYKIVNDKIIEVTEPVKYSCWCRAL